ncbi:MAG: hypothetical protein V1664_05220 [Candidatus Uhrbacteria bacterium]
MRIQTALFLSLALILVVGCGTDNHGIDTGNPDTDADTDADGDTDADADVGFPIDAVTGVDGANLVVSGAKCDELTCWVDKTGVYNSTLEANEWMFVTKPADVKSADGVTVPFDGEGEYATDIESGVYTDEVGGEHDVVVDTNANNVFYIAIGACSATPTGNTFEDDLYGCLTGEFLSVSTIHYVAVGSSTVEHTMEFTRPFTR